MKAFRNRGGVIQEIEVDVDPQGNPILPPDTTVQPKPAALEGHYVTVVDDAWVQIPKPVFVESLEMKKAKVIANVKRYGDWYKEQPVEHAGVKFDGDELSRGRLSQALTMHSVNGFLPSFWIDHSNKPFPITAVGDLQAIATAVAAAFNTRFFEVATLRAAAEAATTEAELNAVVIPNYGFNAMRPGMPVPPAAPAPAPAA